MRWTGAWSFELRSLSLSCDQNPSRCSSSWRRTLPKHWQSSCRLPREWPSFKSSKEAKVVRTRYAGSVVLSRSRRGFRPPVIVGQAQQMSRVCSLGAKIKVIVLDEGGPIVCNRIFHACAKRPSGPPLARAVRCYYRLRVVPAHDIKRSCRIRTKRNKSAAINGAERSSRALRPAQFPNWKVREPSFWLQNQWPLSNWAYVSFAAFVYPPSGKRRGISSSIMFCYSVFAALRDPIVHQLDTGASDHVAAPCQSLERDTGVESANVAPTLTSSF